VVPEPAPTKSWLKTAGNVATDFAIGAAGTVAGGEFLQNHPSDKGNSTANSTDSAGPTSLTNSTSDNPTGYSNPTSYYSTSQSSTNPNNPSYPNNPTSSSSTSSTSPYGLQGRAQVRGEEAERLVGRMLDELD
jgi:hypothetical protein